MLIAGLSHRFAPGNWAWPAGLVVWGPGHRSSPHAHHALQIVLALEGQLRARPTPAQPWRKIGAVIVLPDAPHEIDCSVAPSVLIAFIEPESAVGRAIGAPVSTPLWSVPTATVGRWRRALRAPAQLTDATVRAWFESAFSDRAAGPVDPRVAQVVRALRARRGDLGRVSLAQLAASARLSPSRFAHLFTASIGIPVRGYLLWLRVQRAAASLLSGQTIADAAYGAGFADGAHLARTFRRMLGTAPSDIVRRQASARDIRLDHRLRSADRTHIQS